MAICENCGKHAVVGRSQQHKRGVAGKRWKKHAQSTLRVFKVNIQSATIIERDGEHKKKLCAKCIKRYKKDNKLKSQQIAL